MGMIGQISTDDGSQDSISKAENSNVNINSIKFMNSLLVNINHRKSFKQKSISITIRPRTLYNTSKLVLSLPSRRQANKFNRYVIRSFPLCLNTQIKPLFNSCKQIKTKINQEFLRIENRSMMTGTLIKNNALPQIRKGWTYIINHLKKEPLTNENLINICLKASTTNLKTMQHIINIAFPNLAISGDYIRQKFKHIPQLKITGETLEWNDLIAIYYANNIFLQSKIFKNTTFMIMQAPKIPPSMDKLSKKAYIETKQPFPDYYVYLKDNKNNLLWDRYFDLKSGNFSPYKGHLLLATTDQSMEELSQDLLERQLSYIKTTKKYNNLKDVLEDIYERKDLSWKEKNSEVQQYYATVLKDNENFSPSMVFQLAPMDYDLKKTNDNHMYFKTESFISLEKTRKTLVESILKSGKIVRDNFVKTEAACPSIKKAILEDLSNLLD